MLSCHDHIAEAFLSATHASTHNANVQVEGNIVVLRLHGREIARRVVGERNFEISDGGYYKLSVTTKRYLNALPGVQVYTSKFQPYLNGAMWDGSWETIHR